jgi:hypothetical protein
MLCGVYSVDRLTKSSAWTFDRDKDPSGSIKAGNFLSVIHHVVNYKLYSAENESCEK